MGVLSSSRRLPIALPFCVGRQCDPKYFPCAKQSAQRKAAVNGEELKALEYSGLAG